MTVTQVSPPRAIGGLQLDATRRGIDIHTYSTAAWPACQIHPVARAIYFDFARRCRPELLEASLEELLHSLRSIWSAIGKGQLAGSALLDAIDEADLLTAIIEQREAWGRLRGPGGLAT